jgi:tRNA modification GTPase
MTDEDPASASLSATLSASLLAGGEDTIVAIATPPGRGALATIRVSGPRARDVARALGANPRQPRVATRVRLHHPETGAPLDDALATVFDAPNTYTGEDVLELSTHGGHTVPPGVLAACIAAGCRSALPGEFTRRAVLNGRIDLLQAEAIADLIDARTSAMGRQALAQLDGGLSRRIGALREQLIGLEAMIAYDIDFPGEDDGPIAAVRITDASRALLDAIDALLATAPRAAMMRDGALVVIAGPPNAGKSSLFNALLGDARALVTEIPGTTRDAIEALLDRQPMPLRFVDTAGLRDTSDPIEQLGIEVAARYLGRARVVLACGATDADVASTAAIIGTHTDAAIVPVRTKIDVDAASSVTQRVSAERGDGLAELLSSLDVLLRQDAPPSDEEPVLVTRERHRAALTEARGEIARFLEAWSEDALPATVAAVHLQSARDALGDVTGAIVLDDVLDRVFRDFCIGK